MPAILVVCAANLCRSAIACALLRRRLDGTAAAGAWRIESAGLWAHEGLPAPEAVQAAARRRGLDIAAHRSSLLRPEALGQYDLILTMEQGQKEAIRAACPHLAGHVHTLGEMAGSRRNVADPGDGTDADLEDIVRQIEGLIERGCAEIVRRAGPAEAP